MFDSNILVDNKAPLLNVMVVDNWVIKVKGQINRKIMHNDL